MIFSNHILIVNLYLCRTTISSHLHHISSSLVPFPCYYCSKMPIHVPFSFLSRSKNFHTYSLRVQLLFHKRFMHAQYLLFHLAFSILFAEYPDIFVHKHFRNSWTNLSKKSTKMKMIKSITGNF